MDFNNVCRTCLNETNLSPIFLDLDNHIKYTTMVYTVTGVKVYPCDSLPQNMCKSCVAYMNMILKFRERCSLVETHLLKLKTEVLTSNVQSYQDVSNENFKVKFESADFVRPKPETSLNSDDLVLDEVDAKSVESDSSDNEDNKPLNLFTRDRQIEVENIRENITHKFDTGTKEGKENEKEIKYSKNSLVITIGYDNQNHCKALGKTKNGDNIIIKTKKCKRKKEIKSKEVKGRNKTEIEEVEIETTSLGGKNRVSCPLCYKNLSVRSLKEHMARQHPGTDERRIKCELCDSYILKVKMNRHTNIVHGDGNALKCAYCKMAFESKGALVDHVANCSRRKKIRKIYEAGKSVVECEYCRKTMQRASLRAHVAFAHKGLGHVCEHCKKRFSNKLRLGEHMRSKHGYEKFKCKFKDCEFECAAAAALRNHERRHRGERPFVCEQCGARFHAAYLLAQHTQSHREQRTMQCDKCPARFKARNSLHMHRMMRHGTPVRCAQCARAFSCRHYAVRHMRLIHNFKGPVPKLVPVGADEVDGGEVVKA